jgi:hypothetical protein
MSGIEILVNDSWGIYIPKYFAQNFLDWKGIDADDLAVCDAGPDVEGADYWEAWNNITSDATYTDSDGNIWRLHQDGDLFCYCEKLMTDEEYYDFFGEHRNDLDADSRFETDNWYDTSAEV